MLSPQLPILPSNCIASGPPAIQVAASKSASLAAKSVISKKRKVRQPDPLPPLHMCRIFVYGCHWLGTGVVAQVVLLVSFAFHCSSAASAPAACASP